MEGLIDLSVWLAAGAWRGAPVTQKLNLAQLLSSDAGGIFLQQPLHCGLRVQKRTTPTEINWKTSLASGFPVPVWTHATGRKLINLFVNSCVSLENQPFQKKGPSNRRNGWNTIQSLSPRCSPTWRTQCYAEPTGSGLIAPRTYWKSSQSILISPLWAWYGSTGTYSSNTLITFCIKVADITFFPLFPVFFFRLRRTSWFYMVRLHLNYLRPGSLNMLKRSCTWPSRTINSLHLMLRTWHWVS